jgi:hypothetical protein
MARNETWIRCGIEFRRPLGLLRFRHLPAPKQPGKAGPRNSCHDASESSRAPSGRAGSNRVKPIADCPGQWRCSDAEIKRIFIAAYPIHEKAGTRFPSLTRRRATARRVRQSPRQDPGPRAGSGPGRPCAGDLPRLWFRPIFPRVQRIGIERSKCFVQKNGTMAKASSPPNIFAAATWPSRSATTLG